MSESTKKRGRPKGLKNGQNFSNDKSCFYCEGSTFHWGSECKACDGTGLEIVRKQMQKVYNAKHKLPLNYNLRPPETTNIIE